MSEPTDNPYFDELLWVHGMIRRDLEAVTRLAKEVAAGRPATEVRGEIADLKQDGVLWQLKVNCLHYCRFVHHHHRLEDLAVFTTLSRIDPDLEPVLDRLRTEHRRVATLLEQIEDAAERLDADERVRARVVDGLDELGGLLLGHLEFEEDQLERPLARMHGWAGR
ncbi:MAG: hemerythrin domain-containing protein [Solirubrobacterales bacterium]